MTNLSSVFVRVDARTEKKFKVVRSPSLAYAPGFVAAFFDLAGFFVRGVAENKVDPRDPMTVMTVFDSGGLPIVHTDLCKSFAHSL